MNGELLIYQEAWNSAAKTSAGSCAQPSTAGGAIICPLELVATVNDRVIISWQEVRLLQPPFHPFRIFDSSVLAATVGENFEIRFSVSNISSRGYEVLTGAGGVGAFCCLDRR